ncbi:hypothetical protein AZE42_09151 [Rhizopogon vesiculosus]|uniref:Uncharacterized protein n=1 Tax=Rhizopogon vesiculosus TaxID=180088 RepID=A0A1J8PQ30_9AGAM|nr:hypothetical protein AZE42_09151 [Rhizopogon vesiculosus]
MDYAPVVQLEGYSCRVDGVLSGWVARHSSYTSTHTGALQNQILFIISKTSVTGHHLARSLLHVRLSQERP